ncbi:MAG: bifunctional diaminohydroxyphosphoribosylaminopyrimidine deaminase/5-amino-6-(5-phosphoribosylamino)uracil reductase RibD [Pirellulales bacterium]|nr:bifunctional diaminohydroxyphosphoribosylaminopyrimidine deaminase/5-amino-6-(5-phosphoribosylamino)uracil reductase RibD [Pirellulales bacterium]
MRQAIELAWRGEGFVEPNPMVGCVIAHGAEVVGLGWHRVFGGPHAEIEALAIAKDRARGSTMYVTLEPCCHQGKTPPCTEAIISAGIAELVIACPDPFPQVAGGGIDQLRAAGITVETGVCADGGRAVLEPYLMLTESARPWVIAKWAMTLDGKIATRTGESRWISSPESRQIVHQLRGRVDGILVGRGTAFTDDPQLVARVSDAGISLQDGNPSQNPDTRWPPRIATRIVLDGQAQLVAKSQLVTKSADAPVLVVAGQEAPVENIEKLQASGCEVWQTESSEKPEQIRELLSELGRRQMTNLLVEGGSQVLGSFQDAGLIDEIHVFVAPRVVGGESAPSPIAGMGVEKIRQTLNLETPICEQSGGDMYIHGRIAR